VWYEIVPPETPLTQGDIVEACPVLTFDRAPEVPNPAAQRQSRTPYRRQRSVQFSRVIVMTQACDIEQSKCTAGDPLSRVPRRGLEGTVERMREEIVSRETRRLVEPLEVRQERSGLEPHDAE